MPENLDLSQNQAKDLSLIMGERLPPTVLEGGWGTCITYQIEVEVKRSGFFSSDSLCVSSLFSVKEVTEQQL